MSEIETAGGTSDREVKEKMPDKRLAVLILLFFCTCLVAYVTLKSQTYPEPFIASLDVPESDSDEYDWAKATHANTKYTEAQALIKSGQHDAAVAKLEELKNDSESIAEKSVVDMDIAAALFQKDPILGAQRYAEIKNNTEYPQITRGTALLQVYLQLVGTGNVELARPFLTPEEFTEYSIIPGGIRLEIASQMHALFPFVTAGIVLAVNEISEYDPGFPNSTGEHIKELDVEAERIYDKYLSLFDSSIAFLERNESMRQYIPNTYLGKANFLADLDRNGYVFERTDVKKEAAKAYEEGLARARAQGATITEQFILARYANYLLAISETVKAETLVRALMALPRVPMLKEYMASNRPAADMPFFVAHVEKTPELKTYLTQ